MDKKTAIQIAVGITLIVVPNALTHLAVHRAGKDFDRKIAAMQLLDQPSVQPIVHHD